MPYAATATPVRSIERTSAISPQDMPEASQQHVVLTDERLSAISDTAMSPAQADAAIERAEAAVARQETRYERTGCFGDAADLDRARRLLSQLLLRWRRG